MAKYRYSKKVQIVPQGELNLNLFSPSHPCLSASNRHLIELNYECVTVHPFDSKNAFADMFPNLSIASVIDAEVGG